MAGRAGSETAGEEAGAVCWTRAGASEAEAAAFCASCSMALASAKSSPQPVRRREVDVDREATKSLVPGELSSPPSRETASRTPMSRETLPA